MNERIIDPIGRGRGAQTKDGCSVEVYKLTPYRGELERLISSLEGQEVLELGCGTGRLTRRLLELGCAVTAVDESVEMLQALPSAAHPVQSSIETLSTNSVYDVALLASYIFNNPQKRARRELADSARRHLKSHGKFLLQVHNERILADVDESLSTTVDGITSRISDYTRKGKIVSMKVHYIVGDEEWTHSFQAQFLSLDEIRDELIQAGFSLVEWADQEQGWLIAI